MNTYISKELAIWLREKGCRLPTGKAYYGNAGTWHDALVDLDGYVSADPEFREAKLLLAYSWYDILVTHAKEFWGEGPDKCMNWGRDGNCTSAKRAVTEASPAKPSAETDLFLFLYNLHLTK